MAIVAVFEILEGDLAGTEYIFNEIGTYLVGRAEDCCLCITKDIDPSVSRYHCSIILTGHQVMIQDLGSSNGTYINEMQLEPGQTAPQENVTGQYLILKNGDIVRVGNTAFQLSLEGEASPAPPGEQDQVIKPHAQVSEPNAIPLPKKIVNKEETASLKFPDKLKARLQEEWDKQKKPLEKELLSRDNESNSSI